MTDLNTFSMTGRIAGETKYSSTKNGTATLSFSLAVNRDRKVNEQWKQEAAFFYLTVYGNRATGLYKVLTKGMKIGVQGQLWQDTWTDPNGKKQYRTVFCVENLALLGSAKNKDEKIELEEQEIQMQNENPEVENNNNFQTFAEDLGNDIY